MVWWPGCRKKLNDLGSLLFHGLAATNCGAGTSTRGVYGGDSGPLPSPLHLCAELAEVPSGPLNPLWGA
jgi:hypothetical protein